MFTFEDPSVASLSAVATDADKVVFMPYEATAALASLGGVRELLQAGTQPPGQ